MGGGEGGAPANGHRPQNPPWPSHASMGTSTLLCPLSPVSLPICWALSGSPNAGLRTFCKSRPPPCVPASCSRMPPASSGTVPPPSCSPRTQGRRPSPSRRSAFHCPGHSCLLRDARMLPLPQRLLSPLPAHSHQVTAAQRRAPPGCTAHPLLPPRCPPPPHPEAASAAHAQSFFTLVYEYQSFLR